MSWWSEIKKLLWGIPSHDKRTFEVNGRTLKALRKVAERERRAPDEMAARLLNEALQERLTADEALERWKALTPREQQVTALICLGYTSSQIAARLMISPETVKTHARNTLYKYNVPNRQELRYALANWDFSGWDEG